MMSLNRICRHYQQPSYVIHAKKILNNYQHFQQCMGTACNIYYSVKANPNFHIIQGLRNAGAGMEVSSLYELHLALTAGTPPQHIVFLGPGKKKPEIIACIKHGIHAIYCESLAELDTIETIANQHRTGINVVLRVANTLANNSHQVSMSGPHSQFGMDHETIQYINQHHDQWPCCQLLGVHYYHGSNQKNTSQTTQQMITCCKHFDLLSQQWHRPMTWLGLGLGVGILHHAQIQAIQRSQSWSKTMSEFQNKHPTLTIICEAGRCLVGNSCELIAQVQYTKTIEKKHWAMLDTGYHHHMNLCFENNFLKKRPSAYAIKVKAMKANIPNMVYQLCGPLCTPSDRMHSSFRCQALERGDFIVFTHVGAYALTHSPLLFLGHAPPTEYFIGLDHTLMKCNTFERFYQFHYQGEHHAPATQH